MHGSEWVFGPEKRLIDHSGACYVCVPEESLWAERQAVWG